MNIKNNPLDWMCQRGQTSPGTLVSVAGLLPAASELLLPMSLWQLLPGLRLCLQLLVSGVWDVCGWLFCVLVLLSALCSSNWHYFSMLRCSMAFKKRDLKIYQVRGIC